MVRTFVDETKEEELLELRSKKNIIPHADGYKIEGYFGKHATREIAEARVELLKRQETNDNTPNTSN